MLSLLTNIIPVNVLRIFTEIGFFWHVLNIHVIIAEFLHRFPHFPLFNLFASKVRLFHFNDIISYVILF